MPAGPGSVDSRFRVLRDIGAGSSGTVHIVLDRTTNAQYVMKRIPTTVGRSSAGSTTTTATSVGDDDFDRVMAEVRAMVLIDHPNVVRFKTSFVNDGEVCIVMEKCEGSLADVIERARAGGRTIAQPVLVEWFTELLCAVAHLHSKNIMHRDIKPSNVFLSKRNHVKLGDFGVCKHTASAGATAVGAHSIIGTPHYIAPEVLDGEPYDQRADVWSLGVLFYELCALKVPFPGDNFLAVVTTVCSGEYPPLPDSLDRRFAKMIGAMLVVDPEKRITVEKLLSFLKLPASHPSHPSQGAQQGRAIQREYGPAQIFAPLSQKPPRRGGAAEVPSPSNKFSRRIEATASAAGGGDATDTAASSPTAGSDGGLGVTGSSDRSSTVAVSETTAASSVGVGDSPPRGATTPASPKRKAPAVPRCAGPSKSTSAGPKSGDNASPPSAAPKPAAARPNKSPIPAASKPFRHSPAPVSTKAPETPPQRAGDERRRSPLPLSPFATPQHQRRPASGAGTAMSSLPNGTTASSGGRVMSREEHNACLNRIRNAKSRIDVAQLRKAMRASRSDSGDADTPIFVPGSASPSPMRTDAPPPTDDAVRSEHVDPTSSPLILQARVAQAADDAAVVGSVHPSASPVASAPSIGREATTQSGTTRSRDGADSTSVTAPSTDAATVGSSTSVTLGRTPAASVRSVLEAHAKTMSLEDMDDVLEAVRAFKLERFGPC